MKARKWLAGAALLSMLATSTVFAAEGDKGDKGKKTGGDKKPMAEKKAPKPDKRMMERLEKIAGKPLTDDQMKAVQTAWEKREAARKALEDQFRADVAQTLGMTVDQMAEKEKELRAAERKDKPAEGGAPKEGTKPATP